MEPRRKRAPSVSRGGTLGSRRRAPNDARNSILAAADRLFYAHGIGAVGVDSIAEAAKVTKRTLYYHFASKTELVVAYLQARDEATLEALRRTTADPGAHPGDMILGAFEFVERWAQDANYHGCPFNNAVAEQSTDERARAVVQRHKATMRSWFAQRAAEGGAKDPEALGAELLVLLDGALNGTAVFGTPEAAAVARRLARAALMEAGVRCSARRTSRARADVD